MLKATEVQIRELEFLLEKADLDNLPGFEDAQEFMIGLKGKSETDTLAGLDRDVAAKTSSWLFKNGKPEGNDKWLEGWPKDDVVPDDWHDASIYTAVAKNAKVSKKPMIVLYFDLGGKKVRYYLATSKWTQSSADRICDAIGKEKKPFDELFKDPMYLLGDLRVKTKTENSSEYGVSSKVSMFAGPNDGATPNGPAADEDLPF